MRKIRNKPKDIEQSKVLTLAEQYQLMNYIKTRNTIAGKRLHLICDIMLNTGIRISELAALRIQDTPKGLGVNAIEVIGKGQQPRDIYIAQDLADKLQIYIEKVRPKTLPRHVRRSDVNQPVFFSQRKKPYLRKVKTDDGIKLQASSGLYKSITRAGRSAGLAKHVHPHTLRHSFATNFLKKIPGKMVYLQHMLGHSNLLITSRYLHVASEGDGALAERLYEEFKRHCPTY